MRLTIRLFNAGNKALKHAGYFHCFICEKSYIAGGKHFEFTGDIYLGSKFGYRAFSDIEKLYKFFLGLPLRAFSNVGRYGYSRTCNLRDKSIVLAFFKSFVSCDSKLATSFPYLKIFKVLFHNQEYISRVLLFQLSRSVSFRSFNFKLKNGVF